MNVDFKEYARKMDNGMEFFLFGGDVFIRLPDSFLIGYVRLHRDYAFSGLSRSFIQRIHPVSLPRPRLRGGRSHSA